MGLSITSTHDAIIFIPVFPWIPKAKIIINTEDITSRIKESDFTSSLLNVGASTFKIKLVNVNGYYKGMFEPSDIVTFYCDNNIDPPTTSLFVGKIDFIEDEISNTGQYLIINGRHISEIDMEKSISYSASDIDGATVLKDIIAKLSEFTTTNVTDPINKTVTVNWSEKPFTDCVKDLCIRCDADCFVDNNKDFHFFLKNTSPITTDAIHERDNLLWIRGFGRDVYKEKTQIRIYGKDDRGLPIIYTEDMAGTRELVIKDTAIDTIEEAQSLAIMTKTDLTIESEEGKVYSRILLNARVGERIWISAPRQGINNHFRIALMKHKFDRDGLHTETTIEKTELGTSYLMKERIEKEIGLRDIPNPNEMRYSYNLTFDDDTGLTHYNTQTTQGRLHLQTGETTGTCTSSVKTTDNNITYVELRIDGSDLTSSVFQCSVDGGINWQTLIKNILTTITNSGNSLRVRITLISNSQNPNPLLESLALLYK